MKERILNKIDVVGNCWIWNGAKKGVGIKSYGSMTVGSRSDGTRKTISAHRFSYEVFIGKIPDGMCVCHTCDTPSCVNPDHLFLGTKKDNSNDRDLKGRNKTPNLSGEMHPNAILNWDIVFKVRSIAKKRGDATMLAKLYGVDRKTISDVINKKTWVKQLLDGDL